jgi:hypothetical protein
MADGSNKCIQENGDIAHVTNQQELKSLDDFLKGYENQEQLFWIGLIKVFHKYFM